MRGVSNPFAPAVLVVGRKDPEGTWHYMLSEPMTTVKAENHLRASQGLLNAETTALVREVDDDDLYEYVSAEDVETARSLVEAGGAWWSR